MYWKLQIFAATQLVGNIKFWRSQEHHLEYYKIREFQMLGILGPGNFQFLKLQFSETQIWEISSVEHAKVREFQMLGIFNFGNFRSWKFRIFEIPIFRNPNFENSSSGSFKL